VFREPAPYHAQNGGAVQAPQPTERSIFRPEARQRYLQNQERVVLPRLVSPRVFVYLWVLALFLVVVGALVAFWPLIGQLG
jgi:hypothetical protein